MRLIGIGLAAVLALGALAPAVYSADKASKIDPKAKAQGMKEAPAALQAAGLKCTMTDARFVGQNKDAKTKVSTNFYEVSCQEGLGYVLSAVTAPEKPYVENCLKLSGPQPDGKPSPITCILPENADPKAGLAPFVAKSGRACTVEKARGIGSSPTNSFFEIACQDGAGYILETTSPPDVSQAVLATPCLNFPAGGNLTCTLTDSTKALAAADALMGQAGKGCTVTNRRYILTAKTGEDYFEVACSDGKGWVVERTGAGALGRVIDCAAADTMFEGGCTLTDSRAAKTEQAGLYTRLAKKAGFDCDVERYAPFPAKGKDEVIELKCSNRPDGAVAVFGATSSIYNCAQSEMVGFKCGFTKPEAAVGQLTADLAKLGKNSCQVSASRVLGISTDSSLGYIEEACADGNPGWVVEYKLHPLAPSAVLTCGQAASLGGCKLPTNAKK
ncbi:MAG: hypothetical protein JWP35_3115 [Caulobacter sp.]|nr:hypothetical protein [Caulobacter sp.]